MERKNGYQAEIYLLDLDNWKYDEKKLTGEITPYYVNRYKKLAGKRAAVEELASGYLLAEYLGIQKDDEITRNKHGKPYLVSGRLFFNLSHNGRYAVLAVSDCEIGVDIQKIRRYHEATAKRILDPKQREELKLYDCQRKNEVFSREWSRLEAVLKLRGTGFGEEWDRTVLKECRIDTRRLGAYYLSLAAKEEVKVNIRYVNGTDRRKSPCQTVPDEGVLDDEKDPSGLL